jgi:hypothetical protein
MNPTVEAAWIAAGATFAAVTGTVTVAISAARNTRKATEATVQAERLLRLLERRADAYQDALGDLLSRQSVRIKKLYPFQFDSGGHLYSNDLAAWQPDLQDWFDKQGRLIAYCSPEVQKAFDLAAEADAQLVVLYRERLRLSETAGEIADDDAAGRLAWAESLAKWFKQLQPAQTTVEARDRELINAIRKELSADALGSNPK